MSGDLVITVAAVAVPAVALAYDAYVHKSGVSRERKQATIEAYLVLQNEALENLDQKMPKEIEATTKDHKSSEYKEIEALITRIEVFCLGMNNGIYDKKVAYDICHGFFENRIWARVFAFIGKEPKYPKNDYYKNLRSFYNYMMCENKKRKGTTK